MRGKIGFSFRLNLASLDLSCFCVRELRGGESRVGSLKLVFARHSLEGRLDLVL